MSVRVMTAVWEIDLPASDKIVLLALADCANDEGKCWPGMASLTAKCSKGERTIQAAIKRLVKAGHITRVEVLGKGCNYTVHPRKKCTPAKSAPPQNLTKTPAKSAGKPSRTVNKGLSDDKPRRAKGWPELPDWLPAEPWNAYLDMRKAKRATPTPRAVKLLLADLSKWRAKGHDPGAILDLSTVNNWTGIFEPKAPANDRQHPPFSKPTTRQIGERVAARLAERSDRPADRLLIAGASGGYEP